MRMAVATIDVQVFHLPPLQWAASDHAFDSLFKYLLGMGTTKTLANSPPLDASWVSSVPIKHRLVQFVACNLDFFGVDYNDIVAAINMWRELRLVFAT